MDGTENNYIALCACILSNKTAEAALKSVFPETIAMGGTMGRKLAPINQDTIRMLELRKTMTYEQIGNIYGISGGAVYTRIKKLKQRLEAGTA